MSHSVVSRQEWLAARRGLLLKEKELTRLHDQVCAARRELPWVRLEKSYVFEGPSGPIALADLFEARNQLFVYHFMLAPDSNHICDGCAFLSDHVDAARQHFEQADLSFVAISRAGIERIEEVRKRMGWQFRWVSSGGNSFNYDFGVSFSADQIAQGEAVYNFDKAVKEPGEAPGSSIFVKDGGEIYHSYSSYARGGEGLIGAFSFLDMVPKGRNEPDSIMQWVRLHDQYSTAKVKDCCR